METIKYKEFLSRNIAFSLFMSVPVALVVPFWISPEQLTNFIPFKGAYEFFATIASFFIFMVSYYFLIDFVLDLKEGKTQFLEKPYKKAFFWIALFFGWIFCYGILDLLLKILALVIYSSIYFLAT